MTSLTEKATISHRETARRMPRSEGAPGRGLELIKPGDGIRNSVRQDGPSRPVVPVRQKVAAGALQSRVLDAESDDQIAVADAADPMSLVLAPQSAAIDHDERLPPARIPDREDIDEIRGTRQFELIEGDAELG